MNEEKEWNLTTALIVMLLIFAATALLVHFGTNAIVAKADVMYTEADGECVKPRIRKESERVYLLSREDTEILYRIVEAEATGDSIEQKKNVASCVLRRTESGWGDTVKDVVFSAGQFTPISDGRYYEVSITASTIKAVNEVLWHGKTHECDYFCSYASADRKNSWHSNHLKEMFRDGIHVYYTEK